MDAISRDKYYAQAHFQVSCSNRSSSSDPAKLGIYTESGSTLSIVVGIGVKHDQGARICAPRRRGEMMDVIFTGAANCDVGGSVYFYCYSSMAKIGADAGENF